MPKLTCFTKEKKDGGKYTTCLEGQKKPKAKAKAKEPAFSFGDVMGKVGGGTKEKGYREPAKAKPKKKKLIIVKAKPKVPKITITEAPKKKKLIIKQVDKPTPYKPTVKKINVGKEPAKSKLSANQLKINTERNEVLNKLIADKDTEGIKYIKNKIDSPYFKDQIDSGEKTYTELYDMWIRQKKFDKQSSKMDSFDAGINKAKEKQVDRAYQEALDKFDREGGSGAGAGAGAGESAVSLIETSAFNNAGGREGLEKFILGIKRNIKGSARLPKLKDTSKSNILTGDGTTYGTPVGLYKLIFTSLKNVKHQEIFERNIKNGLIDTKKK